MPYVPPHLRPGYIPTKIKAVDFTGKVHWPTNLDKDTNIVESSHHSPKYGIVATKSIVKLTEPITLNTEPIVRPGARVPKFNLFVKSHLPGKPKKTLKKHKKYLRSKKTRRR